MLIEPGPWLVILEFVIYKTSCHQIHPGILFQGIFAINENATNGLDVRAQMHRYFLMEKIQVRLQSSDKMSNKCPAVIAAQKNIVDESVDLKFEG